MLPNTQDGDAGFITVQAEDTLTLAQTSKLEANGNGSTTANNIQITSNSGIINSLGTLESSYNGTQIGRAGKISINCPGNCNVHNVFAEGTLSVAVASAVNTLVDSVAIGGDLSIQGGSMSVSGLFSVIGTGTQNGGTITVQCPDLTIGQNAFFDASGGNQGGSGGRIEVKMTNTPIVFPPMEKLIFNARGFDTGEGGRVILHNTSSFRVNTAIRVDSGDSTDGFDFNGSISLNGVLVYRWKTGFADWPKVLWTMNSTPSDTDIDAAVAAHNLPSTFRQSYEAFGWHIYTMVDFTDFNNFFRETIPNVFGITTSLQNASVAFTTGNLLIPSTLLHECGHALDVVSGFPSQGAGFATALANEKAHYNSVPCTQIFAGTNVCTQFPNLTNWERFQVAVLETTDADEIWGRMFEYKAAVVEQSLPMDQKFLIMLPRTTELNQFMNDLWP